MNGREIEAKLICRYADVREVLRNPVFSREAAKAADDVDVSGTILGMDGEQHARVRAIVNDSFTKAATERLHDIIRANALARLNEMTRLNGTVDLVADYATPLSLGIICDMLGVPEQDRMNFREWGKAFLGTADLTREQAAEAAVAMGTYLTRQLMLRRTEPQDDLLSRIAGAEYSYEVLASLALALIVGGWETASSSIARYAFVLLTRPYEDYESGWSHLLDHADEVDSAVMELERLYSTSTGDDMPRVATRDITLPSGNEIRQGEVVIPSHDAANRDPSVFSEPERMDFRRHPNPHLSFGYGAHHCIGRHLGGLEVRAAIRLLLERLPTLSLAVSPDQVEWSAGHTITSPTALPVTW
ncbi:cytochrome P450 [Actinoallomurus acaciae]|uniref:Cytochrome P450 n=1 Tax=Actinoallomurus acaciae TaxID=502577 RepID=A0ABV5YEU6_9ACTN